MQIRALIVDDEAPARSRLRQMLADCRNVQLAGECSNGRQAIEWIRREPPDVVFLDIQMPRVTGLDVCAALAHETGPLPLIVFVTAYDEFAVKAFELRALDYLLKPFEAERLQQALSRVREQLKQAAPRQGQDLAGIIEALRNAQQRTDRLVLKENGRVLFVPVDSVDWVEADGNYVRVHAGPESHYVRETLRALEAQLPGDRFVRISRSVLVSVDRIKEMQPLFYGDYTVLLRDGSRLNLSRSYRERLEPLLRPKREAGR